MALPWLKVECNTPDKPEVLAIAGDLNLDPDAAFGKIFRIWTWFDQHTENGNAPSVTKMLLDRVTGVTNFCNTLIKHGWMIDDGKEITLPNFERHNGESAKQRANTNRRVAKVREKKQKCNADSVTNKLQKPLPERELDILLTNYENIGQLNQVIKTFIPEKQLVRTGNRKILQSWIDKKITGEILKEAIERAQSQTNSFNLTYLDKIIIDLLNPKQNLGSGSNGSNKKHGSSKPSGSDLLEQHEQDSKEWLDLESASS